MRSVNCPSENGVKKIQVPIHNSIKELTKLETLFVFFLVELLIAKILGFFKATELHKTMLLLRLNDSTIVGL